MKEEDLIKLADEIYAVGFKNGQIEMKNKVLKRINRDWTLIVMKTVDALIMILKGVNKIPLSKPKTTRYPQTLI